MAEPRYFLNVSLDEMSRANMVGSMCLEHPRIRAMHDALEALISKLRRSANGVMLIKELRPNILLTGATGVGKELVAQAFRLRLLREKLISADSSYGSINCACLSSELLEIELFGCTEHAFTGAGNLVGLVPRLAGHKKISPQKGLTGGGVPRASLLFLDEIGAAERRVQAKLLRLVENREFTPLGVEGKDYKAPYLIIVAATNELSAGAKGECVSEPPESRLSENEGPRGFRSWAEPAVLSTFRSDLFHRLCDTFHFHLPPLSERSSEIPQIAQQFFDKYYRLLFDPQSTLSLPKEVIKLLQEQSWLGNGRQLHQVIRRATILWDGDSLESFAGIVRAECESIE